MKVEGMPHSKIPSIFDHMVRNSSTIESNYHLLNEGEFAEVMYVTQHWSEAVALITDQGIMHAGSPKLRGDANRIHVCPTSAHMCGVMGQPIRGAHMHTPTLHPNAHASFILMQHWHVHQGFLELTFNVVEGLMTGFDKAGDAARGELHAEQIVEQLTGASIRHHLAFDQRDRQCLDAWSILGRRFDRGWKAGSRQMKTGRTLFFFCPMFSHPEKFRRQVNDLASLCKGCWTGVQILLTVFAPLNRMHYYHIGSLHLLEVMPPMAFLSSWLFAAFLLQALGKTHEPIRRWRQVVVVAISGLLPLQYFHPIVQHLDLPFQFPRVLLQTFNGLDGFCQGFAQDLFLLLQLLDFLVFFVSEFPLGFQLRLELFPAFCLRHASTLPVLPLTLQRHSPTE